MKIALEIWSEFEGCILYGTTVHTSHTLYVYIHRAGHTIKTKTWITNSNARSLSYIINTLYMVNGNTWH